MKTFPRMVSIAALVVAAVAFAQVVSKELRPGMVTFLLFCGYVLLGPLSILYLVFFSGWPVDLGSLMAPLLTLAAVAGAVFAPRRWSRILQCFAWLMWLFCELIVAGSVV